MNLTVVFEHWHLGDGNYPAFAVGNEARLSFELDVVDCEPAPREWTESVRQIRDAEYEVVGRIIRRYEDGVSSQFPVFEADWFRFYSPSTMVAGLAEGSRVRLRGTIALDHYLWVEFLERYPDPPDLFYNVRVARIRRVSIPQRFVHRGTRSLSYPTSVGPDKYATARVEVVQTVDDPGSRPAFSLLDLELLRTGTGPTRPTFLGS